VRQLEIFNSTTSLHIETVQEASIIEAMGSQGVECHKLIGKEKKKAIRKANAAQLMNRLRQQEFRCALSGIELTPETARLDHIVPVSQGGTDEIDNLQWLHVDVNTAKGTMSQDQFVSMCRKVAEYMR
jgi:5-methylcytosine-specific restriction endonuclease McrA